MKNGLTRESVVKLFNLPPADRANINDDKLLGAANIIKKHFL